MRWAKDASRKNGGRWLCAVKARERSRRWQAENRERQLEHQRKWREANPETQAEATRRWQAANRERILETQRRRYARDPERKLAHSRRWQAANREKVREYDRQRYAADPESRRYPRNAERERAYKAAHPEKAREQSQRRRARKASLPNEKIDLLVVFDRDGGACCLCGSVIDLGLNWPDPLSFSLDHIVPLSRGGAHLYSNVQASHLRCNLQKGAAPPPQKEFV